MLFSKQTVAAISEITFRQCGTSACYSASQRRLLGMGCARRKSLGLSVMQSFLCRDFTATRNSHSVFLTSKKHLNVCEVAHLPVQQCCVRTSCGHFLVFCLTICHCTFVLQQYVLLPNQTQRSKIQHVSLFSPENFAKDVEMFARYVAGHCEGSFALARIIECPMLEGTLRIIKSSSCLHQTTQTSGNTSDFNCIIFKMYFAVLF